MTSLRGSGPGPKVVLGTETVVNTNSFAACLAATVLPTARARSLSGDPSSPTPIAVHSVLVDA
jgi:hypothetical protein